MAVAGLARRLFRGGVHPDMHKARSTRLPIAPAELPSRLILPLHQHIGEPAEALVRVGERVLKGQPVARPEGYVSAPIHAPTSGTIADIGELPVPHPSGLVAPCIVIEPDGREAWFAREAEPDTECLDPVTLRNRIREAGIVGLGGAGFPTHIKLNPGPGRPIDTLILNGAECEPYITCDDLLMRERADEIASGLRIVRHALQARRVLIGIEDNKPEAIAAMAEAITDMEGAQVVPVPTMYPAGDSKLLIRVLTGKAVASNRLSAQAGVIVVNVGTTRAIHRAIAYGEPLLSRIVTVTGEAVGRPRNLEVLLGTPMDELLRQCETRLDDIERLIMGGPMMGFALHRADVPVIKTTNCILAATAAEILPPRPVMPCIRCGACSDACPMNLLPQQLYWHARNRDLEKVQRFDLFDCIECGACAFVCPSNIPLVQYFRYAKGDIWVQEREREKAQLARRRHDARQARVEREKAEREARRRQKRAALEGATAREQAQSAAGAAREQAEKRRSEAMARSGRTPAAPSEKRARPESGEKNEKNPSRATE